MPKDYGPYYNPNQGGGGISAIRDRVQKLKDEISRYRDQGHMFFPAREVPQWNEWSYWERNLKQRDEYGEMPPGIQEPEIFKPENKKLPYGAIGWDAFGRPYWGGMTPFHEWWLRATSLMKAPGIIEREVTPLLVRRPNETVTVEDDKIAWIPSAISVISRPFQAAGSFLQNVGMNEQTGPTYVTMLGRALKGGIEGVLAAYSESAQQFEQASGATRELTLAGAEAELTGGPKKWHQALQQKVDWKQPSLESPLPAPTTPFWRNLLLRTAPGQAYYAGRYLLSNKSWEEKKRMIGDSWNAGRVLYSSFFNATITQNYLKRYRDGENPYILSTELMNPTPELIGQVIFDPINFIGMGASKARMLNRIDAAKETYMALPKAVDAFFQAGDVANDTRIAQKITGLSQAVAQEMTIVSTKMDDMARSSNLLQFTNESKRFIYARETGEIFDYLVRTTKGDPDEILELTQFMIKMADPENLDEVATGVTGLLHHQPTPRPFFTKAGMRASVVLRRALVNEEGVMDSERFLKRVEEAQKGGIGEMIQLFDRTAGKALDSMYPTILERVAKGEDVSPALRAIARFHELAYTKGPYRFFNSLFASVYMGMNPGYAFRNLWTNVGQTFVDEGPGAVFVRPQTALAKGTRWNGGITPRGLGGFTARVGGLAQGEKLADIVKGKVTGFFLRVANLFEENSSKQVIGKVMEDTMRQVLDYDKDLALPSLSRAISAGLEPEAARLLKAAVFDNYGDVDAALADFIGNLQTTGSVNAFRGSAWMNKADIKYIQQFGLWDEFIDTMKNADNADDAVAKWSKLVDDLVAQGDNVVDDISGISLDNDAVEVIENMSEARLAGNFLDEEVELAQDYFEANHRSNMAWEEAVKRTAWEAEQTLALRGANPDSIKTTVNATLRTIRIQFGKESYSAEDLVQGVFGVHAKRASKAFSDETWAYSHAIDSATKRDELVKIWNEARLPGEVPKVLDKKAMKNLLWQGYWKGQRDMWQLYREAYADAARWATDELGKLYGEVPNLEEAEYALTQARRYDGFLADSEVFYEMRKALAVGDNAKVARTYARQFGIPTATEKGVGMDKKLLRIINRYSETKYDNLGEVPQAVSRDALMRYAIKEPAPETMRVGITSVRGYEPQDIDIMVSEGEALIAEGKVAEGEKIIQDALEPGMDYLRRVTSPYRGKAEFTYGRYMGAGEPSIYHTTRITEDRIPDLLYSIFKTADEKFRQSSVILYQDILKKPPKGVKIGEDFIEGGTRSRYLPALNIRFTRALTAEDLDKLDEAAATAGLPYPGFTITPDRKGLEIVGVLKYNESYEDFQQQLVKFANQVESANGGLVEGFTDGVRRTWLAGNADPATGIAERGGYRYGDYYQYFESSFPQKAAKAQGRLAEVPYVPEAVGAEGRAAQAALETRVPTEAPKVTPDMKQYHGGPPSAARMIYEQRQGLGELRDRIAKGIRDNWGRRKASTVNPQVVKELRDWAKEASGRIEIARLIANKVAVSARDFVLHAYPAKRNFDLVLSYLYPFHFWYNRTYANWLRRIVQEPEVIAAYAKYKEYLSRIHADAPDWWKYNLSTNDLPGLDSEHPIYFNLEATLNPMYGLTGVDFEDPRKRVNWFTSVMDDVGKFGPSVWTPFQLAIATALYQRGEKDAAARWAGRIIPQTAVVKSVTALLGAGDGWEIDPGVLLFADGLDIYERRRVGRSLGGMIQNEEITQAQAEQEGYMMQGPAWDEAKRRSALTRAPGQLLSFLLGTGFKIRPETDRQIDVMDDYLYRFYEMEGNLSPDEVANTFEWFRARFPFFDTVVLARKGEEERDRLFAYSVIGRIPPGQKDDLSKAVGIAPALMDKFYDDKGRIWEWPEADRQKFMSGMMELGALLEVPDTAVRHEYREAAKRRAKLEDDLVDVFGEDIGVKMDMYFDKRKKSLDLADDYLKQYPEVADAMDFRTDTIMADDLLKKYYGSLETVRSYLRSQMFDVIEKRVGTDIGDKWNEYFDLKLIDEKRARAYYKAHPELGKYIELRDGYDALIARELTSLEKYLPDKPYPLMRTDLPESLSVGQQDVMDVLGQTGLPEAYNYTLQDWQEIMPRPLQGLLEDYYFRGEDLPEAAVTALERVASPLGVDPELVLALYGRALGGQ